MPPSYTGRDLTPTLRQENPQNFEIAFIEYADNWSRKFGPVAYRSVRSPRDKLIVWEDLAKGSEFFDLEKDPGERINLIDDPAYQKRIARLRRELQEWQERTGDKPDAGDRVETRGDNE